MNEMDIQFDDLIVPLVSLGSVYGSIYPEMTQNDSSDVFVSPCSNLRL